MTISKIAGTYHAWKQGVGYADAPGFCKAARLEEIRAQVYVLTPGRYGGAEEDGEPFEEKIRRLTGTSEEQFIEGRKLEAAISENLKRLEFHSSDNPISANGMDVG
ncbi:MAG: N-6 DNA methylase [Anaerolineales bacterium]|nr:N-6 DNA methylase [Anaerolineales bacterium]